MRRATKMSPRSRFESHEVGGGVVPPDLASNLAPERETSGVPGAVLGHPCPPAPGGREHWPRPVRARLGTTGNHTGLGSPVAFRSSEISRAICVGAASTFAFIAGSLSHSAKARPSRRTVGPHARSHPNPRGSRYELIIKALATCAYSRLRSVGSCLSNRSPTSMRRNSAETAANLVDIQPCMRPRNAGEIGWSART